jgi:CTP:phosphocholine cytidylyltransferase-like protein
MVTYFNLIWNKPWNYFILLHHVHDLLLQHYFIQVDIFLIKGLYQTEWYS